MSLGPAKFARFFPTLAVILVAHWGSSILASPPPSYSNETDWRICRKAVQEVERGSAIPRHLLAAIARVESGRRNPGNGSVAPWPWTINAEGQGRYLHSKAEAVAEVRILQARGVRSIDVGCMQINLMHHPNAFAGLDEALDPLANVRYAAQFLQELQNARNNWIQAAANYHSNTAEFALAYQRRVMAALPQEARIALDIQREDSLMNWGSARAQNQFIPGAGRILPNNPPPRLQRVTGRGLDSYRHVPISAF